MRDFFLALLLAGCTPQAGSDCPPVPQVGQPCSKEGVACLYGSGMTARCTTVPEYKCQNGRWIETQSTLPTYCGDSGMLPEGGTDAAKDGPSDG